MIVFKRKIYPFSRVFNSSNNLEVGESLVVKDRLGNNSREGKHSKSAVGNFLKLKLLNLSLSLAIEVLGTKSEVTGGTSRSLKHLGDTNPRSHLGNSDPDEDVSKSTELNGGIVDGGRGGSRHGLGVSGDTGTEVNGNISEPGELTHTSVLELGLTEVVRGEVVGDAKGVESDISDVSLAVLWVGEEGDSSRLLSGDAGGSTACKRYTNYC